MLINKDSRFSTKVISYAVLALSGILWISSSGYAAKVILPLKEPLQSPGFNWAGPYLGGYVGGAWGHSQFNTDAGQAQTPQMPFIYFISTANISSVVQNGSMSLNPNAFTGGVQAGDNWTLDSNLGQFVYGLALDFGSFAMSKTNTAADVQYPSNPIGTVYTMQTSIQTEWLFTARGRAGLVAKDSWPLIYATGGLAVTRLQVANFFSDKNGGPYKQLANAFNRTTKSGWTAGGGVEFPINDHFTVNAEYLYVDFGSVTVVNAVTLGAFSSPFVTSANLTANTFKVGANYKFG